MKRPWNLRANDCEEVPQRTWFSDNGVPMELNVVVFVLVVIYIGIVVGLAFNGLYHLLIG